MHGSLAVRLGFGLAQGVLLALLDDAAARHAWPATDGFVFAPLLLIAYFVPAVVMLGLDTMRPRTLALWAGAATILIVGLALHDMDRGATGSRWWLPAWWLGLPSAIAPSCRLVTWLGTLLSIAQSLVAALDGEASLAARYERHFDTWWRMAGQVAFGLGVVLLFRGALLLGDLVAQLGGIDFAPRALGSWVAMPATALVFAAAVHASATHRALLSGVRGVALVLLACMIIALIQIALVALVILIGERFASLWEARYAPGLPIAVIAFLVMLINAAFQDGRLGPQRRALLRRAGRIAALLLVPLLALAGYGLALEIAAQGWTPGWIVMAAIEIVAACYALGYAAAALSRDGWPQHLARANLIASAAIVVVMIALLSPIADPARLAVADQMARLRAGTPINAALLRRDGGRWGKEALVALPAP